MSVLRELYRGEIRPDEENQLATEELTQARSAYLRRRDKLLKRLDASVREDVEALLEERMEVASFEMEDAYVRGMRMGAQLMSELLTKKDRPHLA